MALTTSDVLSHSMNNAIANWEALLLEIGVTIVMTAAFVLVVFGVMFKFLDQTAPLPRSGIVAIVVAVIAGVALWGAVTTFLAAASTRLYIDGERAAAAAPGRPRTAYRVFVFRQWLAAGRALWAPVFWIQVAGFAAIVIVMGLPALLIMSLPNEFAGCVGCAIFPLLFVAFVFLSVWPRKAIVIAVGRGEGVEESLGAAWDDLLGRLGEHLVPLLIIGVFTAAASSLLASIATAAGACWARAAFVSLTETH